MQLLTVPTTTCSVGQAWRARCIQQGAAVYMRTGEVPKDKRGAHFKIRSAIDDKQIQQGVLALVMEHNGGIFGSFAGSCGFAYTEIRHLAALRQGIRDKLTEKGLKVINLKLIREVRFFFLGCICQCFSWGGRGGGKGGRARGGTHEERGNLASWQVVMGVGLLLNVQVCEEQLWMYGVYVPKSDRVLHKWMQTMGFAHRRFKKGLYTDVHEHPLVVAYRQNVYLPFLRALRLVQQHYEVGGLSLCGGDSNGEKWIWHDSICVPRVCL
jgi:hypothetical protein